MVKNCDICGSPVVGQQNYCGGCGVDLREPNEDKIEESNITKKNSQLPSVEGKETENKIPEIKWCWLRLGELPHVLVMIALLVKGKSKLGFCECAVCNQGYREWLAFSTEPKGKVKLKASSREIVKKAREADITKTTLNVAYLVNTVGLKENNERDQKSDVQITPTCRTNNEKIYIELDETVIERAILNVLSSEKGQKIIKNAYSPKERRSKEK